MMKERMWPSKLTVSTLKSAPQKLPPNHILRYIVYTYQREREREREGGREGGRERRVHVYTCTCIYTQQVRAEVSLLHKLKHAHVIDFIGVVLQPLCFILEWACGGSLHSVLQKYKRVDARVSPFTLQQTIRQVAT